MANYLDEDIMDSDMFNEDASKEERCERLDNMIDKIPLIEIDNDN